MNIKGTVIVKDLNKVEKIHTWMLDGKTPDYCEISDVSSKALTVHDIAVDESSYLCLVTKASGGQVLVDIDKRDIIGFLPVVKKDGVLMSAAEYNNPLGFLINEIKAGRGSDVFARYGNGLFEAATDSIFNKKEARR
jgi:hypothetical protein